MEDSAGGLMVYSDEHPIGRAVLVVRLWIFNVILLMLWNAWVANGYLLQGVARLLPYLVLAVSSTVWIVNPWKPRVAVFCSSLLAVGVTLRAAEVVLFATSFDMHARLTGASMWVTIAGTALAFGVLNVLMASRKAAEREAWLS